MSAGETARALAPRQVWRERRNGRMVVIVVVAGELVFALDPEREQDLLGRESEFRAHFDYIGLDVRGDGPDHATGAVEALTLRGLQGRSSGRLHRLIADAGRRRRRDLVRLARQVLALRGENPGTREQR